MLISLPQSSGYYNFFVCIFTISCQYRSLIQKPPVKAGNSQTKLIRELDDQLTKKAISLGIDLFGTVKRETVAKCFNQIGICVPYDKKTLVGYRPLTMRNGIALL